MTSERFEVLKQKLLNKVNMLVCVVYTEIKECKERKRTHTEL